MMHKLSGLPILPRPLPLWSVHYRD